MRSWFTCLALVAVANGEGIFAAVRSDSAERVVASLDAGASLDGTGPGGQTPLMHAVLQGKDNAVSALLSRNADTTIGEKDGYTPMHGAGFQGRAEIAKLLFAHGLDIRDVHRDGFAPIDRACWGREPRHTATVLALLELGVEVASMKSPIDRCGAAATATLLREWQAKEL